MKKTNRTYYQAPKTEADILKEIEQFLKVSQEERNRREGNYTQRKFTPYGKYEEIIIHGKRKKNNYFLQEKKISSNSLHGGVYGSKKPFAGGGDSSKTFLHSVDELLHTYADELRNREKHSFTEQEMKVKAASVPYIATEKKVDAYLTLNPKPNLLYSASPKDGKGNSNHKDQQLQYFAEDNRFIEIGKEDSFSLRQLDPEILEGGSSTSALYGGKTGKFGILQSTHQTNNQNHAKDRLKHISATRLRKKYPRFCSNLAFTDLDLKTIQPKDDKWITKFMEICYDECTEALNSEALHGKQHYYEGMNLGNLDNFPFLVQRIIAQYFSVLEIRKRITLEMLYTIELIIERSEYARFKSIFKSDILRFDSGRGQLFSKFLSEEFDVDILALFLQGRIFLQNALGKKLKDINPSRMLVPMNENRSASSDKLLESKMFQQRVQQQQIFSPNATIHPSKISWFSTSSGENNAFLTNLQETDNYLHATFSRSISQSVLPRPPPSSSSSNDPTDGLLINKIVPVELPSKWYYLVDVTLQEAPVIGFHESLLWPLICSMVPSPPQYYSIQSPHLGLSTEEAVQQVRHYLIQKIWELTSQDIMKDTTNQRLTKTSGIHQISSYTFLRTICNEWKKLSREEKAEFSYEGLLVDSLKSLNKIYDNNCAKLKQTEAEVLDAESNLIIAKAQVSRIEKELKRNERKFQRKIAHQNDLQQMATLRQELNLATVHRQDCEHKLQDIEIQKKKLTKTTEELWAVVMSRANRGKQAGVSSPTKKLTAQEVKRQEEDYNSSLWKNYITFMFSKILERNNQKEITLKESVQQSRQLVDQLNKSKLIKPTPSTLITKPLDPKEIMKSAEAIEKLFVETMARIFVRSVINDGKRKVLLSHHLNIRQHELLLLYGSEEYLRQEQERQLKKRLAEQAAQREKERRAMIHYFTPIMVETIIEEATQKAFDHLYDPYWMLDLPIRRIVGYETAQIVENKYEHYSQSLLAAAYRRFSIPIHAKQTAAKYHHRLSKITWKRWLQACSENMKMINRVRKIQRCIRAFLWTCRYLHYLQHQQQVMQIAEHHHHHKRLQKQGKLFLQFWFKYLTLHQRYTKTKEALLDRRFLICFYTWKDKFIKLRYQKMKLSKLQFAACVRIQCIIRQYIANRRVRKLFANRALTSWIQILKAKKYRERLQDHHRQIDDYSHRVMYNSRFLLIKQAYFLWKQSYNILFGLAKVAKTRNHYNCRFRFLSWQHFTFMKTKYLSFYATRIQSVIRMFLVTRRYWQYHRWRRSLVKLQSSYRKHRALYYFTYDIYYYRRAKLIQKIFRGYRTRKNIYLARVVDIHYAASHNKYERLKYYCENFPQLIYMKDGEGNTPLHSAAKSASKRTMKLLIKHMRLNPNEVNANGFTALHLLIMSNAVHRDEIFNYVLERGFDDDQLTITGKSCVLLAAEYNRMIILKRLLDDGHDANLADQSGLTPVQCACSQGNLAMLELLIENEATVHQSGKNGTFPIHDCVTGKNIELLYILLREKVDVNVTDPIYSQTPLMWAAQAGLSEFCRTLIIHHADIHHKDYQGRTVAHYAAMCNHAETYHALREGDVEFDCIDAEGNSPLHISAYYGTNELTKNILHGGVYPSYQNDQDGEQPSHIAAKYNQLEILQLLCEYDEHIGRPNYHHQTPLGLAKFYNCRECIDFLEKHYRMVEIIDGRNAIGDIWWDKQIDEEILSAWEVVVQSDGTRLYVNKVNGERTLKPPSVKSADVIKELAKKKNALPLRRVIELVKEETEGEADEEIIGPDGKLIKKKNTLTKHEYYLNYKQTKAEIKLMSKDYRAATTIVKYARRKLAYLEFKRLRVLKAKFKVFRRFYRLYIQPFLRIRRRYRTEQAIKIQKTMRGYLSRKHFYSSPNGLYYQYRLRWGKRVLRYNLWHLYSSYRFRKELALKIAIKYHYQYTLEDWQVILDKARKPIRVINIFEEYQFPNMMNLKFYRNLMTGKCFFIKPAEIIAYDEKAIRQRKEKQKNQGVTNSQLALIVKLQALMRGYLIRNSYKYLEKAMIICQYAKQNYLTMPEKDSNVYNYALYCFIIDQDIERARTVFLECLRRMQWRGPDNAFVLYSYAIFAMKSHDEDIREILQFIERANQAERWKYESFLKRLEQQYSNATGITQFSTGVVNSPYATPRDQTNPAALAPSITSATAKSPAVVQPFRYGRVYDLAKVGFFRYAATTRNNSYGWECYALCMFLVFKDFTASFDAFMEAFKTDPANQKLRKNFDLMMIFFHGKDKDQREAVISSRMRYLASLDNEIEENRRRARERQLKREMSAKKIQKWYKERRSIRIFNAFLEAVRGNIRRNREVKIGGSRKSIRKRQNISY